MSKGTACVRVNRNTGEVLHIGYVNHPTRQSEGTAEVAMSNAINDDPEIGYIELGVSVFTKPTDCNPAEILAVIARYTEQNCLGFNIVLGRS